MQHQPEKENAPDAVVFSIVTTPPVSSVEIENPTVSPGEGICDWCRNSRADIWCDKLPICFNCLEKMIERENAIGEVNHQRGFSASRHFQDSLPPLWEK